MLSEGRLMRRRTIWPTVAAVAILASACGSTVQSRQAVEVGGAQSGLGTTADGTGTGGSGLSGTTTTGGQGSTGSAGAVGSSSGGGGFGGASGGSGTATGSGTGSAGGSSGAPGSQTNVSKTGSIKVGYMYTSDQQAVAEQVGAKGIVPGDTGAQYRAIAADLNKRGGILGHKVELIGHNYSTAGELNNASDEENKACTDFVQDRPVFAVLGGGYVFLAPCLAKHGIPSVGGGGIEDPATINSQLLYDGGGMLIDVLARAFVDRLAAQRYFTGWNTVTGAPGPAPVKIGLIYQDIPLYRHYFADIKARLKSHGFTVDPADEFLYSPTVDGVATQSQAAVLKFGSDGVTHVFGAALLFIKAADNQNYHPRYGLDSAVPPALLAQNIGASQLRGALAIGWRPTQDVDQAQDPGPVSPLATRCTKIIKDSGQDVSARTVVYLSHVECEQLWSLAAALERGGTLSLAAVTAGFDTLGQPTPVVSFGERWAGDRHASNTTVADLGYVESCSCFKYTRARTSF